MSGNPKQNQPYPDADFVLVDEPEHPANLALLEYYHSITQPNGIAMRRHLSGIFLAEPHEDDVFYKVMGSEIETRLPSVRTGETLRSAFPGPLGDRFLDLYRKVRDERKMIVIKGRFIGFGVEHATFEALMLPMIADDGNLLVIGGMFDLAEIG